MKCLRNSILAVVALVGLALRSYAVDIVNNTWLDSVRTDPASPVYSENGIDIDLDGDVESAFYNNGNTMVATPGHLTTTMPVNGTSSASWTTYFTDTFANSVNLVNVGDSLRVTWVFTMTGVNANNASQGFHMGIVQSPSGGRLAADGTPANQVYAGYGSFWNIGNTLGRGTGDNFDLMEWAVAGGANNILSTTAAYVKIGTGDGTSGGTGYADSTQYTYTFTAQRVATGLQLDQTIVGGSLNGTGGMTNSFLDTTVSSFTFDTFAMRPTAGSVAATGFDTTLFNVQLTAVPEPAVVALLGLGSLGLMWSYRRTRY